ncbi:hypothetical protein [Oligoflexus sp.]|uniref:hypothetical protein n=1 Tax=Oligoflexus sp. TaxID=1971216 RepID=UPI002D7814A2|nr:hypothetical protein [Oligoflexus sp.]
MPAPAPSTNRVNSKAWPAEIDFELAEQRLSPRYPLMELFVSAIDATISEHVTVKLSHKIISEYFGWSDAKVKKLIQRLSHDKWIRVHSERRSYWVRYEINQQIVKEVKKEKLLDLRKFNKIKQKCWDTRNELTVQSRTGSETLTETAIETGSQTTTETSSETPSETVH